MFGEEFKIAKMKSRIFRHYFQKIHILTRNNMNQDIKKQWVNALRSGEYKQTEGQLKDSVGYCCLGVLCDLHAKAGLDKWVGNSYGEGIQETYGSTALVRLWSGIDALKTTYVLINGRNNSLANHNDNGATFLEIADAIEEQL